MTPELRSELVRTLLQLALEDLVAIVQRAVHRNTTPGGQAAAGFEDPAAALARFDRLGGFDALSLELWQTSPALGPVLRDRPGKAGIGQLAEAAPLRALAACLDEAPSGPLGAAGNA